MGFGVGSGQFHNNRPSICCLRFSDVSATGMYEYVHLLPGLILQNSVGRKLASSQLKMRFSQFSFNELPLPWLQTYSLRLAGAFWNFF